MFLTVDCDSEVMFYHFQMCVVDKWSSTRCVVHSDQAWKTKVPGCPLWAPKLPGGVCLLKWFVQVD